MSENHSNDTDADDRPPQNTEEEGCKTRCNAIFRRDYLKQIGVTSTVAVTASGMAGASKGERAEVVTLRDAEGPVETREVPKAWKQHIENARRVRDQIENDFLDKSGIHRVGIGLDDTATGELRNKVIEIGITGTRVDYDIPEEVDGIPIVISKNEGGIEWFGCYEKNYDVVPGGVSVAGTVKAGSSMCRATKDGAEYLLTARHLFNSNGTGCDNEDNNGETLDQPAGGYSWGDVDYEHFEHDLVAVNPEFNEDTDNDIINEANDIQGWVTDSGYDTYESDGTQLDARGNKLCSDAGTVISHNNSIECSDLNAALTELVYLDNISASSGDSGGIVYFVNDKDNPFVGNIISGGTNDVDVFGAAAYAMHDFWGYSFG